MLPLPLTELFCEDFQAFSGQFLLERTEEVFQCVWHYPSMEVYLLIIQHEIKSSVQ